MARISDDNRTPAQRAADANPTQDGPLRRGSSLHKRRLQEKQATEDPSYVVAVSKTERKDDDPDVLRSVSEYSDEELRAKAKMLLSHNKLSAKEHSVLKEILEPDLSSDEAPSELR